ncbi:MAG: DUF262 domain-containing protein [Magnetococcales bacterium]|nr:DUF262 domain-containing protein [Magnetococcales bacterium]
MHTLEQDIDERNDSSPLAAPVNGSGVEEEDIGISEPFDPAKINVVTKQMSLDTLIKRMKEGEIDLSPDFQRNEVWKKEAKSRLIESILIRIPLPAFYMDATNEEQWLVVDGLQRLSTLRDFIISREKNQLLLEHLEFLKELEGKGFQDLPRPYQRRIEETQVTVYLIEKGTPPDVKFNIFKRINTGGMPLSSQEIRHALHQGPVTKLLKELAESKEFKQATDNGIQDQRLSDQECVLRVLAFMKTPYLEYNSNDLDSFISSAMAKLNQISERERANIKSRFIRIMQSAAVIFGNNAFRKSSYLLQKRNPINKALLEAWSVNLDKLSDDEITTLIDNNIHVQIGFTRLMSDKEFENAVTAGTGTIARVRKRFHDIEKLIQSILDGHREY